jgi:hypothetical protein
MYICIHIGIFAYTYVYMHTHMYVYMHTYLSRTMFFREMVINSAANGDTIHTL